MDLLHLVNFKLRFKRETRFHFFHHAAMYATIMDRLGNPDEFPEGMAFYTPERGRAFYRAGDLYNFGVALRTDGPVSPGQLVGLIASGPKTKFGQTDGAPFGDNYVIDAITDAMTGGVPGHKPPTTLLLEDLGASTAALSAQTAITLQFLSPVYIRRTGDSGRTLMDGTAFYADKFLDVLREGLSQWWPDAPFLQNLTVPPDVAVTENRLLRTDVTYPNPKKWNSPKQLQGVSGQVTFSFPGGVGAWAIPLLLGGIIGVSRPSNRRMGQGRYKIAGFPVPAAGWPPKPAVTILQHAAAPDNFAYARMAMVKAGHAPGVDGTMLNEFMDELTVETPRLAKRLRDAKVDPAPLRGLLIRERKEDGTSEKLRPLAIPTLTDRFLQRCVLQELEPAVSQLWEDVSHAFRKGLSHLTARHAVDQARNDGFVHVLDADIKSFFDQVDWDLLRIRLEAYFGDDPVVDALMDWTRAPIDFSDTVFHRQRGLPQGSVVSPMLANLYLDALDESITAEGYKLVRYCDDFVILCKQKEQTSRAMEVAREELERLHLVLNDEKTRETSFDDGFKFLGAMFCRSAVIETNKENGRVIGILDRMPETGVGGPGGVGGSGSCEIVEPRGWLADFLAATASGDVDVADVSAGGFDSLAQVSNDISEGNNQVMDGQLNDSESLWLVVESIRDHERRWKIHELLRLQGTQVGNGTFEIVSTPSRIESLLQDIACILDPDDELRIYRVCARCRESSTVFGPGELSGPPVAIVV